VKKREHPYTPPAVGSGMNDLRTPEAERSAYALGYYVGRRYWDIDFPMTDKEREIFDKDKMAYACGYDLGSYHARSAIGFTERELRELKEKSCQTAWNEAR
jgi:hypothetical protein